MSHFRTSDVEVYVPRQAEFSLRDPSVPHAGIKLIVSDAWARFWIVDRLPGLSSFTELERYAARQFQQIFGDDPASWVIRIDPMPFAARWLVCALPAEIALGLPRKAEEQGWRVRSIQPHFISELNAHCRTLSRDIAICLASQEATTIGLSYRGEWAGIRVHPPLDRSKAGFKALLLRDCMQCGLKIDKLKLQVFGPLCEAAR